MSTVATPAPEAQPPINHFGRMIGAIVSPKKTFGEIAKQPSWVLPAVALTIIWLALNVVMVRRVDWVEVSRQQIEKNKWAASRIEQLPPERKAAAYQRAEQQAKIVRYVRGVIGWPLLLVVAAGIYLGVFKLLGGARINYSTSFAITAFAHIPMGLRELLAIPVVFLKDPASIDPDNFLASNVGAFLGGDAPLWQIALFTGVDVFGLWSLFLVAVGFAAADPKKLSLGKALTIAFSVWAAIVLFFTGIAWIFS